MRAGHTSGVRYRFVDCRWDLADPEAGRRAYLEAHGHLLGHGHARTPTGLPAPAPSEAAA